MVKHNNVLPNVHLRKHWQKNVRTWLNQAGRKKRRLQARRDRAAAIAPRPLDKLRPSVRCMTIRYNHRPRLGRGFTLNEIKAAGLGVQFAKSIGISVDYRRKDKSQEAFDINKQRLNNYLSKLVLFPRHEQKPVTKAKSGILNDTPKVYFDLFRINKRLPPQSKLTSFPTLPSGSDPSASLSWKDFKRPALTAPSDKNGATSAMPEDGKRRLEKPQRRNDFMAI